MRGGALAWLLAALGFVLACFLLRDAGAIFIAAPLDPNEGWNATFAARAAAGETLYPGGLLVNNYPPLSFYVVGVLGILSGDFILAGRLISFAAFCATATGIAAVAHRMGCARAPTIFAALFFAAALLLASDYVAMDDPQLLGHAMQLGAFMLLWRAKPNLVTAALLFAASLFVKHNLLALPAAVAAFLILQDRRAAWRFVSAGLSAALAGLVVFRLATGENLIALLVSPRGASQSNFVTMFSHVLAWAGLPFLVTLVLTRAWDERPVRFVLLYLGCALLVGMLFASGDGVDANIFFDVAIALSLAGALILQKLSQGRAAALGALLVAPLLIVAAVRFEDDNFAYTPGFRIQAARDIAFLKSRTGPALCEMLSLCVWAGKPAAVDVFNLGEAFKTGKRNDTQLVALIEARYFAVLQFDTTAPYVLGPRVQATLAHAYRLDHKDDNGVFFVPR